MTSSEHRSMANQFLTCGRY